MYVTVEEWVEKYNRLYNTTLNRDQVISECNELVSDFRSKHKGLRTTSSDFESKLADFVDGWSTKAGIDIIKGKARESSLINMRKKCYSEELKKDFNTLLIRSLKAIMIGQESKMDIF